MQFLPPEVARRLIEYLCDDELVLVGGQAVMFWAHHYGVLEKASSLTRDIDFAGSVADVEAAELRLSNFAHETTLAQFDDSSPNSGAVLVEVPGVQEKVRINFLGVIKGLSNIDVHERSVPVTLPGSDRTMRVLHPTMCLESKIANLASIPAKRSNEGIEQARLSVEIVRAFLAQLTESGQERQALRLVERIGRMAKTDGANYAFHVCGVDVMVSIPT